MLRELAGVLGLCRLQYQRILFAKETFCLNDFLKIFSLVSPSFGMVMQPMVFQDFPLCRRFLCFLTGGTVVGERHSEG